MSITGSYLQKKNVEGVKETILYWNDKNTISKIHTILRSGGVVIGSSDTVIGFFAFLTKEGFESLNSIKQPQEKPYLILVESQVAVDKLIDQPISGQIGGIMERFWPGPLTYNL